MRTAVVIHGPSVWVGREGEVLQDDGHEIVLRIECQDDAGAGSYDVRFPRACVSTVDGVPTA